MPERFIFRQVYFKDIPLFLSDGEIRAKNHPRQQACHQTSYPQIVSRRGTTDFALPCGGVVNDYVPFYFSPITAFTFTIYKGNVELRCPENRGLGAACQSDRVFFVARTQRIFEENRDFYFSNIALTTLSTDINLTNNKEELDSTVNWSLFDDTPTVARIPEIGYQGVCRWYHNRDTPTAHQNRQRQRMAEFLIKEAVPLSFFECIVAENDQIATAVRHMIEASGFAMPVYVKPGCYY